MNILIIGAGNVGGTLGKRWSEAGHNIYFGVRNPEDSKYAAIREYAHIKSLDGAVGESDLIVLATPWKATKEVVTNLSSHLDNKILVDCTNPLKPDLSGLDATREKSGAHYVAEWAKGARVVKAFNTTGFNIMAQPVINDQKSLMPVASDDEEARKTVMALAEEIDFDAVDFGNLSFAYLLENFALTWISLAYMHGMGRDFAFTIQRAT